MDHMFHRPLQIESEHDAVNIAQEAPSTSLHEEQIMLP
jgi:hypothetical protein